MERVAKRFLLHNHHEKDNLKESSFDELKQNMQIVRFEMLNDITTVKENLARYSRLLHCGLNLLGEYFLNDKEYTNCELLKKFEYFRKSSFNFYDLIDSKQRNFFAFTPTTKEINNGKNSDSSEKPSNNYDKQA